MKLTDIEQAFARFREHFNSNQRLQYFDTIDPTSNITFTLDMGNKPYTLDIYIPLPDESDPFTQLDIMKLCLDNFNESTLSFDDFDEVDYGFNIEAGNEQNLLTKKYLTHSKIHMTFTLLR